MWRCGLRSPYPWFDQGSHAAGVCMVTAYEHVSVSLTEMISSLKPHLKMIREVREACTAPQNSPQHISSSATPAAACTTTAPQDRRGRMSLQSMRETGAGMGQPGSMRALCGDRPPRAPTLQCVAGCVSCARWRALGLPDGASGSWPRCRRGCGGLGQSA